MQTLEKVNRINYYLLFVLTALLVVLLFSIVPGTSEIRTYFNSDTLYLPSLFLDIFVHHSGIGDWHLNAAPNFFPDMLLYFLLMSFLKKTALTSMVYSILQALILLVLINYSVRILTPGITNPEMLLVNFTFLLILISPVTGEGNLIPAQILLPAYHCGFFINSLLSLVLMFRYLQTGKLWLLMVMGIVVLLAVLSDRLYLMGFVFPALVVSAMSMIRRSRENRFIWILLMTIVPALLGLFLFRMIRMATSLHFIATGWKMFNFENIPESFHVLLEHMRSVIELYPVQRWLVLLMLFFMIGGLVYLVAEAGKFLKDEMDAGGKQQYQLVLFMWIFVMAVYFAPVINGSYVGHAIIRYNFAALITGSVGFTYLLLRWLTKIPPVRKLLSFAVLLLTAGLIGLYMAIALNHRFFSGIQSYVNYYPRLSEILDQLQEEHDLSCGIANYWEAKKTTIFSTNDVRLYAVSDGTFRPTYHVTNENWYHRGGQGRFADPVFNYLVTDGFRHTGKLHELFGERMDTLFNREGYTVVKVPPYLFERGSREIFLIDP